MAGFSYVGIDKAGKRKKGSLEAEDQARAISLVKEMNLIPIEVQEQSVLNRDIELTVGQGVKPREMGLFCRQFSSLLRAGVTVVDALGMLADTTANKGLAKAVREVSTSIQKGDTLGYAMSQHDRYFNGMLISLVEAGEASGTLDLSFERMGTQFEKDAKTSGTVKKAMVYPIVIVIVAFAAIILMLLVIVPKFEAMFEDMDMDLPKITVAVVNMSNYIKDHVLLLLVILVLLGVALYFALRSSRGRHVMALLGVKLPIISNFVVKTSCARFTRTLATLTGSGLSLVNSLEISARTMTNILFREAVQNARDEVMRGVPLSEPLLRSGLFPNMVVHMVRIGEETGDLDSMMTKLADYYDEEVDNATGALVAALEPAIIIVLAGLVGTLLAAVLAPILKMYSGMSSAL